MNIAIECQNLFIDLPYTQRLDAYDDLVLSVETKEIINPFIEDLKTQFDDEKTYTYDDIIDILEKKLI